MKGIKMTVLMLIFCQAVVAQTKTAEQITAKQVEKLNSKVVLSEGQKQQVTEIILASTKQMQGLKEADELTPEMRKEIKKAEREQVKELLTDEQKEALREAHKDKAEHKADKAMHKADRLKHRAEREVTKNALQSKRKDFDVVLTTDEKAVIAQAKTLVPAKVKGKDAREALSEAEKAQRKTQMKEVRKMLKPIVNAHKTELDEIATTLPPKKDDATKNKKKNKKGFAYKFLLMD